MFKAKFFSFLETKLFLLGLQQLDVNYGIGTLSSALPF